MRTLVSRPPESSSASARLLQRKLAVTQAGDAYERDADRVADQVMATPERSPQHTCSCGGTCADCQQRSAAGPVRLQTKHVDARDAGLIEAPSSVHDTLSGSGRALDAATRAFMEPRFGVDFTSVRVHDGARSARSAREVSARAYTVGQHIVFGAGEYAPETNEGRRLIAHELAHVVQQTGAGSEAALQRDPKPDDAKQTSGSQDLVVLFGEDKSLRNTATVLAPGVRIVVVTSADELAKQLKAIKGSIRTLYIAAHMLDDGNLMFETPGVKNFVSAEMIANKIKGTAQVENINFQGCSIAQSPMEMQRIAGALKATKATGSTCTLVEQTAPPVEVKGKPITQSAQLNDKTVKAAFEDGLKKSRNQFADKKKNCIINDTVDGYFAAGGKLVAYWANPESMADDTGWDDTKSVCYKNLKVQKLDPTKKMPVIDPNDCKLIELSTPKP